MTKHLVHGKRAMELKTELGGLWVLNQSLGVQGYFAL